MPKAKTGCDKILYTRVSQKAIDILEELAAEQGVSRAIYLDRTILALAKRKTPLTKIEKPEYYPHKPVKK